jgi:type IV pilus assembly protein PilE
MEQVTKHKGVSLIELMVAMSICGILSAVAVPSYQSTIKQVRKRNIQTKMLNIHVLQQAYYLAHGKYASEKQLTLEGNEHYRLYIDDVSDANFVIKVIARKHQARGEGCDKMSIDAALVRLPVPCW